MKPFPISLLVFALLIFGCEKQDPEVLKSSETILGSWHSPSYSDTTFTLQAASELSDDEYGLTFYSDQTCIERKNAGSCGTPPIVYDNFDGTWELNDSVLNLSVAFWGGTATYKWKIITMHESELKLYRMEENYLMEEIN